MKLLFVGEGRHDIGSGDGSPAPWRAGGVIPALTRRVVPTVSRESLAIGWNHLRQLPPERGLPPPRRRVLAARVAGYRHDCAAVVCVVDRDGDSSRLPEMELDAVKEHPRAVHAICAVAVESIEAWTLGATAELAAELGVPIGTLRQAMPAAVHVEALRENSGSRDHRPKGLLARLAKLAHREDCTELREAVAEQTDPVALAIACPQGFEPFSRELRRRLALS